MRPDRVLLVTVTVATLYRGESCETYVAVLEGDLTYEQERAIAHSLDLATEDGEVLDMIGFTSMEVLPLPDSSATPPNFTLINAFPEPHRLWTGIEEATR